MNEFRKFIRYIVPVLTCILYAYLILALFFGTLNPPGYSWPDLSTIQASVLLIVAGGIGFFISMVHHLLFLRCKIYPTVTYRVFLQDLVSRNLLRFSVEQPDLEDERNNWTIINIIWHSLRGKDSSWEKINDRNDSLTDLMHSNGSIFVSLLFAIIIAASIILLQTCYAGFGQGSCDICFFTRLVADIGLILGLLKLHYHSYRLSTQILQNFVEKSLFHVLGVQKAEKDNQHPYVFYGK